jgi:hypothetical protein
MITLTGDFHLVPAGVTAGFAAVFFSTGYIAQAGYVRALFSRLLCHYDSIRSEPLPRLAQRCDS